MIHGLQELVWGPWMLAALLGMGLYLTVAGRCFQIRGFRKWWGETGGSLWRGETETGAKEGISSFQTACTALAATIGTGNIAGVATALTAGGPGAIFWMWVSAAIGMMTAYGEAYLGVRYRRQGESGRIGGPMAYLENGLGLPGLGLIYSFFCVMASLGMGSMVQANALSQTVSYSFPVSPLLCGAAVTVLVGAVAAGGEKRIASVSGLLIPVASGVYVIFSLIVILSCWDQVPEVLASVLRSAFEPASAAGGSAGYLVSRSVRYGVARGVFSNEAGLGTLAILHGAADEGTAESQGMWAMFEVFFDTIVVCTLTALVILLTAEAGGGEGYDGAALTALCFSSHLGAAGEYLVSGAMILFAFATMVAWSYMGKQAFSHLIARTALPAGAGNRIYMVLFLQAVFLGSLARVETVWELSDLWNGLMAVPNLMALFLLRKEIVKNIP